MCGLKVGYSSKILETINHKKNTSQYLFFILDLGIDYSSYKVSLFFVVIKSAFFGFLLLLVVYYD